ncbi:MAG: glucosaminidase domain-containing protein [Bacteroidota bacterium]
MANTNTSAQFWVERISLVLNWMRRYAFELVLILIILHICLSRGIRFNVNIHDPQSSLVHPAWELSAHIPAKQAGLLPIFDWVASWFDGHSAPTSLAILGPTATIAPSAVNVSMLDAPVNTPSSPATTAINSATAIEAGVDHFNSTAVTDDPAPHINNLTIVLSPDYIQRHDLSSTIVTAKRARLKAYLDTYAPLAQAEMREHGVLASITLAQALLESNAGDSRLARQSNNHFGIKCKSRCLGCTCRNYGDDTRYDMFRVFEQVADSYQEHSALLLTARYSRLHTYGTDYEKWAHGLKACGYATDSRYAHKLIKIIEGLGLDRYDRI